MTDRELLELAAKAAGLEIKAVWYDTTNVALILIGAGNEGLWSPLINDGDAFRLFVKLNLWIQFEETIDAWEYCGIRASEPYGDDNNAATRRAIVRAAAEIGKTMQG